jgi:hypothetical protein
MTPSRLHCWPSATPAAPPLADLELWAGASRNQDELTLHYRLSWAAANPAVLLPPRALSRAEAPQPQRRDGLWQHTCFEAFLAPLGEEPYWELNLSASGDWNVYRFAAYRSGQRPEEAFTSLPFALMGPRPAPPQGSCLTASPRVLLELDLRCPLQPALAQASQLQLGLSAVLEHRGGALSYWALSHPGPEPDFHDRRGWILQLPANGAGAAPPPNR